MTLYIDPGTGSMLFTILLGLLGTAGYLLRNVFVKLRFLFSGGAGKRSGGERIPFAVFSDDKRYWTTFEPVCDEFEKRGRPLVYMTASPDDPALRKSYEHVSCRFIGEGNRAYAKLNRLQADILLSTTPGLDIYQWRRSKGVKWYVHVLHMATDPTTYRMFGLDCYDAVLLSGAYQADQIRTLEKLRGLPAKELLITGLPYLDRLQKRYEEAPPLPDHPVTLLLASSWGASSLLNRYGEKILKAALATGYHIIVRPHPQSFTAEKELLARLAAAFPDSGQLEWNRDADNFDALRRSDIMISDFSGVMLDFSLVFGKPVIYADTSFDKSPYDAWWLEDEKWVFKALPRIGRQLLPEHLDRLKEIVDETLKSPGMRQSLEEVRNEAWAHRGESARLVADYLLEKEKELAGSAR